MSKIMKYMSIAALALTGALMSSCGTDDDIIENAPQTAGEQPAKKDNIVVVTTTVNRGAQTKALTPEGVKTFAVGEQVAIQYWQEGDDVNSFKAVSNPLTESDITNGGKSAKLTFTLVNPKPDGTVYFVYPAAMADEKGAWDPSKLDTQDGTLSSLAANLDLGTGVADMVNLQLPNVTLDNQFTILAITLKNSDGTVDITNTITSMTVREVRCDLSYTVNRTPADGPIYVAIQYILESDVEVIATDGTKIYTKTLTNKSYDSGEGYSVGWRMTEAVNLSNLSGDYVAQNGDVLTGTLGGDYKISIADGSTVTLNNVTINGTNSDDYQWAGINCEGDATIILSGTNNVKGFHIHYPGIHVPTGKTLTIDGTGSLNASSNGQGSGIGGGYAISYGNIVIEGGAITATGGQYAAGIGGTGGNITISGGTITARGGSTAAGIGSGNDGDCGNIYISGGTITAYGGKASAGIGGGFNGSTCGNITITSGVTSVTATKGSNEPPCSIGKGADSPVKSSTCGTVTIGGTVYAGGITTSPYTYQP